MLVTLKDSGHAGAIYQTDAMPGGLITFDGVYPLADRVGAAASNGVLHATVTAMRISSSIAMQNSTYCGSTTRLDPTSAVMQ